MIPESYKNTDYGGPERRKGPPVDDIREVTDQAVKKIKEATDKAQDTVMQIYADSNNLINNQFQVVENNINRLSQDVKEVKAEVSDLRKANQDGHQHIIDTADRRSKELYENLETLMGANSARSDAFINGLVGKFEQVINAHEKALIGLTEKVDKNHEETHGLIRTTNGRINDLEERMTALEQGQIKSDADKWREFWATVRNLLIGAILTGALTFGGFLIWGWQEQVQKLQATVPKVEGSEK